MKYLIAIALFLTGFSQIAVGQSTETTANEISYIDVLYMKDGSEFRGTILEYFPGESVKMRLLGGHEIVFMDKYIRKIVQERQDCVNAVSEKPVKEYSFREKGLYNFTSSSSFSSIDQFGDITLGLSINHVIGFQFNRFAGIGIGTGYDNYVLGNSLAAIPLYIEARGYILKANTTPYYSVNAGIGFPIKKDAADIIGGTPGLLFHPAIGYRVGGGPTSFVVDVGYKIQKLTYEYRPRWEQSRLEHNTFKRLTVRLGVLF